MSKNNELEEAISALNAENVAWIHKHNIYQLRDRAILLQQAGKNAMNDKDEELVESSTNEFLQAIEPVIQIIQSGEYK